MITARQTAIAAGVFFLITHVTSITARFVLFDGTVADPTSAAPAMILIGALLDAVLAIAVVGTAIAVYPVVRRASEGFALGYVALRTLEASVILTGVVMMLGVVSVNDSSLRGALVAIYDLTFIVGPGLVCGVNTVVLAAVLYRSRLVPRFIPMLGLIGGPLVIAINVAKLFAGGDLPSWLGVTVVPIFAWELCLAVYLIARGFRERD